MSTLNYFLNLNSLSAPASQCRELVFTHSKLGSTKIRRNKWYEMMFLPLHYPKHRPPMQASRDPSPTNSLSHSWWLAAARGGKWS